MHLHNYNTSQKNTHLTYGEIGMADDGRCRGGWTLEQARRWGRSGASKSEKSASGRLRWWGGHLWGGGGGPRGGGGTVAPRGWGGGRGVVGGVGWRRQRVMAGDGRTREIKWRCSGTVP
jgi:hypothetical protein